MIRIQPDFIRHLKNQDKYCYMALDLNYKVIEHIIDQPLHYCLYAININANAIFYINKRTKEMYDAATKKDPKIIRYLDIIY